MLDLKEHLRSLVEVHGPSGHEGPVREVLRPVWAELTDSLEQDGLGSLIGIKRATKPQDPPRKIMLAAHMDEIGLMVRDIVDGFIYVHRVSGVDNRVMPAQPVIVHGKRPLPGVVATTPPHLLTDETRGKYASFDELVVDVGLPADEVAELVTIGDLITPDVPMIALQGKKLAAKSFDDRACVAAVTLCLDMLQTMHHSWDVYATATVQEESGLIGAATAAYHIEPDLAIALDVTFAPQPGVGPDGTAEMGGGPAIGIGPNFHDAMREKLIETAKSLEMSIQEDPLPSRTGTDAWSIQIAREGIPTQLISVPLRNMHSPVETVDLRDIERSGRLLAHFIAGLDADFLAEIAWKTPQAAEPQES